MRLSKAIQISSNPFYDELSEKKKFLQLSKTVIKQHSILNFPLLTSCLNNFQQKITRNMKWQTIPFAIIVLYTC